MTRTAIGDLPEYLTRKDLSALTGISVATFARWAVEKKTDAPAMTRFGPNLVRYAKADVIAWLESRKVSA